MESGNGSDLDGKQGTAGAYRPFVKPTLPLSARHAQCVQWTYSTCRARRKKQICKKVSVYHIYLFIELLRTYICPREGLRHKVSWTWSALMKATEWSKVWSFWGCGDPKHQSFFFFFVFWGKWYLNESTVRLAVASSTLLFLSVDGAYTEQDF